MEESGGVRKGVWGEREREKERVDVERRGEKEGKRREEVSKGREEGKGERKGRLVWVEMWRLGRWVCGDSFVTRSGQAGSNLCPVVAIIGPTVKTGKNRRGGGQVGRGSGAQFVMPLDSEQM